MTGKTKVAIGAAVVGAAAVGFYVQRTMARKNLKELLDRSPAIQMATTLKLVPWTIDEKVEEAIPLLSVRSAEQAFAEIMTDLIPTLPPEVQTKLKQESVGYTTQVKQAIESATGVDIDAWVDWALGKTKPNPLALPYYG